MYFLHKNSVKFFYIGEFDINIPKKLYIFLKFCRFFLLTIKIKYFIIKKQQNPLRKTTDLY